MRKICLIAVCFIFMFFEASAFGIQENKQLDKTEYINKEFWANYNDCNLTYYISRALDSNHDLKLAAINSEIYSEYIKLKRADELPSIGAGFSPAYSKIPNMKDFNMGYSLPIYVSYEADIFLKNHDKTLLSKKDYEMSLLDEKSAYISVASIVGGVYFNILKAEKAVQLQERIVQLRENIYNLMKISNEQGTVSTQDVIQAYQSYLNGKTQLSDLKKELAQLKNNLAVLIGSNPEESIKFEFSDIEKTNYKGIIPASVPSASVVNRPDYKKAELMIERAGIDIRAAKKEFLPTINLTGLSFFSASKLGSLLTTKSALMSLGASAFADLFTGGKKVSNYRIKKSQYQQTLISYEKTNLTAIEELNNALVKINFDKEKFDEIIKQNSLQEKDYSIRQAKFNQGVISKLELLQAEENLLVVKMLMFSEKADCLIDYIGLYKAMGAVI